MSLWKKAVSVSASAALLASLFAMTLAPTVSAAAVMAPTTGPNTGGTLVSISGGSGYTVATGVTVNGVAASVTSVSPDGTALTFITPDISPTAGLVAVATTVPATIGLPGFFATTTAPGPVTLTPASGKDGTVVVANTPGQTLPNPVTVTVRGVAATSVIRNNSEQVTFAVPATACPTAGGAVAVDIAGVVGEPVFTCSAAAAKFAMVPTTGPTGTVVQLSYDPGTFDLACQITVDALPAVAPTSVAGDGSKLTFLIPSAAPAGAHAVSVAGCTSGVGGGAGNFTVTASAASSKVSPTSTSYAGGGVIQVTGTGFSVATLVYLSSGTAVATACYGPIIATSVASNGTSLTFVMPSEATVEVGCDLTSHVAYVWTTPLGTAPAGSVTYTQAAGLPTVTAVSPNSGSRAGGNTVTVTGTNFVSGAKVFFGTAEATSVTFVSATSLTVVAPSGVGVVAVTVQNPDGQSAQLPTAYTYTDTGYVCGAGTALGVTTTGPFGTATVVANPNQYVTYKFSCGSAGAGQKYTILGAKRNADGTWGAFTAVTSRIADSGGNVYYYVRTTGGQWWSFRMQIASSFSPARQARWL